MQPIDIKFHKHMYYIALQAVSFEKRFTETALRVRFRGTIQGAYGSTQGWIKLQIYFNGAPCTDPGRIDFANYNFNDDVQHHKASGCKYR